MRALRPHMWWVEHLSRPQSSPIPDFLWPTYKNMHFPMISYKQCIVKQIKSSFLLQNSAISQVESPSHWLPYDPTRVGLGHIDRAGKCVLFETDRPIDTVVPKLLEYAAMSYGLWWCALPITCGVCLPNGITLHMFLKWSAIPLSVQGFFWPLFFISPNE